MRGIATGGARGPAGADGVGVPVGGTTGQVLAKNSNTDFDTAWVDVNVPGSGTAYVGEQLFRQVVGAGGQASFDIPNIPGGYDKIEIFGIFRSVSSDGRLNMYFNGDTVATNYRTVEKYEGAAEQASASDDAKIAILANNTWSAGLFSIVKIVIPAYDQTTSQKQAISESGSVTTSNAGGYLLQGVVNWENSAAINRITLIGSSGNGFLEGTLCTIVGYRNRALGQYPDYLASMGLTTTKTLVANTTTTLSFDAVDFDSAAMASVDRSYYTIPVDGIYEITGRMTVHPAGGTVDFTLNLMQNAVSLNNVNWRIAGNQTVAHYQVMYKFTAGDQIMFRYTVWTSNTQLLAGTKFQIKRISQSY